MGCLRVLIRCLTLPKRLKLARKGIGVTQQIPSLVLICDAKTWSLENRNKTVSDTGLSLCTDRVLDFVQEMGDLKLTLKGVGVTPQKSLP